MNAVNVKEKQLESVYGLTGKTARNLDPKRRLTINGPWRQLLAYPEYVYVAPVEDSDGEPYLELLPVQVVKKLSEDLSGVLEDDVLRDIKDNLFESFELVYFDSTGRIRIPDGFLEYAGIEANVLLRGAGDRIKVSAISEEEKSSIKVKSCSGYRKVINARRRQLQQEGRINL